MQHAAWCRWLIPVSASSSSPPHHAHICRIIAANGRLHVIPNSQLREPYFLAPNPSTLAVASRYSGASRSYGGFSASCFTASAISLARRQREYINTKATVGRELISNLHSLGSGCAHSQCAIGKVFTLTKGTLTTAMRNR